MAALVARALIPLMLAFAGAAWLARAAFPRPASAIDPALAAFGFSACPLPCWAGVEVGRTPFERAGAEIAAALAHPHRQIQIAGAQIAVGVDVGERQFSAQILHSGGLVGALRLRAEIAFAGLVSQLGPPTCGRSEDGLQAIWLMPRGDQTVAIGAALDRAVLDGAAHALWIALAGTTCASNDAHPWRGLGPGWLYR